MQAYAAQRAVVTRYIKEQMTEGVDYYTLTIKGRVSKATLARPAVRNSCRCSSSTRPSSRTKPPGACWAPRTGCCATPARS